MLGKQIEGVRGVQELFAHKDFKTTMVCTHVLNRGGYGIKSPVDTLLGAMGSYAADGYGEGSYSVCKFSVSCGNDVRWDQT